MPSWRMKTQVIWLCAAKPACTAIGTEAGNL
jgi:hypothetical protein